MPQLLRDLHFDRLFWRFPLQSMWASIFWAAHSE
jgi:hypothetical protein